MVILDTGVVAELMRRVPDPAVMRWVAAQPADALAITAPTVGEILSALAHITDDRRRGDLSTRFGGFLRAGFAGRIFAFDLVAASMLADVKRGRLLCGRPIGERQAALAAIARARNAAIATRFGNDFADCGVDVIDPWRRTGSVGAVIAPLETGRGA
ncbi:VapC toxin family PIN domain ribonuclease [Segnochrobactraceae bacterium EtOH-i3]